MAITSYAELQTAMANWLIRDDLTNRLPEFIDLFEAEVNRRLRIQDMETRATATLTSGSDYLALPTDFGGLRGPPKITSVTPPLC